MTVLSIDVSDTSGRRLSAWPQGAKALLLLPAALAASACFSLPERHPIPESLAELAHIPGIPGARYWGDEVAPSTERWLEQSDEDLAAGWSGVMGRRHAYLAISGGGQNGAFGAGLLKGWSEAGTRPEFTVVTGISTGALIAPFAFLGPEYDDTLEELYTQYSTHDLVEKRSLLAIITGDAAVSADPLRGLVEKYYDQALLDAIAVEGERGRSLAVATTNLDAGRPVTWNITRIAMSGDPRALSLFHQVLMASAAIPIAFPPVMIDVEADGEIFDEMHVDGGATAQVFWCPAELDWAEVLDRLKVPGMPHVYVIRNGFLESRWKTIERGVGPIAGRTFDALIRTQGQGDLYRIYVSTKRDGLEFRLAHIPEDFDLQANEQFDKHYMRALFNVGYEMAVEGYPWELAPDGVEE
ncbi:MAG: hypothetical protein ACI8QZ_002379 [Chlamydiales bacterium]|jgi:hypothetical protein